MIKLCSLPYNTNYGYTMVYTVIDHIALFKKYTEYSRTHISAGILTSNRGVPTMLHIRSISILLVIPFILCADYKHVIFDFGGVILEHAPYHDDPTLDAATVQAVRSSHAWRSWMRGTISYAKLIETLSYNFCYQDIIQMVSHALSPDRNWIYETVAIIQSLKQAGYQVYLLSNISWEGYRIYIHNEPLFNLFDGILCSWEVAHLKPERRIYEILLERYHLSPHECIFIDDKPENTYIATCIGMQGMPYCPGILYQQIVYTLGAHL